MFRTPAHVESKPPRTADERPSAVLICTLYYLPHRTGMQIYIQRLAEGLARRGHAVTILAARHLPDLPAEEMIGGVRIIRLAPLAGLRISRGMLLPSYPVAFWKLARAHDVISVHTPILEAALIGWLAALRGRPMIVTHHGDLVLPKGAFNRLVTGAMFAMFKSLARRAMRLVGYSTDYADHSYYLAPFRRKVEAIAPPIVMPPPDATRAAALRALWSRDNGPVIGFAGRFVAEKRPDLLIRALDLIHRSHPAARVVFIGQHHVPYEDTWSRSQPLIERYRPHLVFVDPTDDPQYMADFYAACDVLALPSDTECFALVQVEAMLSGTPVVATDIPGARVPITVTGMGKLVPPGDSAALGAAIISVIGARAQYAKPRSTISGQFSSDETVARYQALFERYRRHV